MMEKQGKFDNLEFLVIIHFYIDFKIGLNVDDVDITGFSHFHRSQFCNTKFSIKYLLAAYFFTFFAI